jgi:hypothetical protein
MPIGQKSSKSQPIPPHVGAICDAGLSPAGIDQWLNAKSPVIDSDYTLSVYAIANETDGCRAPDGAPGRPIIGERIDERIRTIIFW